MIYKIKLLLVIILAYTTIKGQKPSKQEFFWAIFHPIPAIKVKHIYLNAQQIYKQPKLKLLLDSFNNGGKLDAFRHVFFMAAFAQKIKPKKLRKLGIAHEKSNYNKFLNHQNKNNELPDSLSNIMDLNNNELGFKIGDEHKKVSLDELKQEVIQKINKGEAVIMKRNKTGTYISCDDNLIDLKNYENKWFIPKCLVKSDFNYTN